MDTEFNAVVATFFANISEPEVFREQHMKEKVVRNHVPNNIFQNYQNRRELSRSTTSPNQHFARYLKFCTMFITEDVFQLLVCLGRLLCRVTDARIRAGSEKFGRTRTGAIGPAALGQFESVRGGYTSSASCRPTSYICTQLFNTTLSAVVPYATDRQLADDVCPHILELSECCSAKAAHPSLPEPEISGTCASLVSVFRLYIRNIL